MPATAGTITSTCPGTGVSVAPGGSLGTFSFVIPAGETAASAQVTLDNTDVGFVGTLDFYLNGGLLGLIAGISSGQDHSFSVSNLSDLSTGSAVVTWAVDTFSPGGCECVTLHGDATLTITTTGSPIPEPASLTVLAGAVLALGAHRRRRTG